MAHLKVRNRVLAATLGALLALTFAGCADDAPTATDDPTTASETETEQPATEEPEPSEPASGESVDPADFVGRLQNGLSAATTAHVTLKTTAEGGVGFTAEGDMDLGSNPPAMYMSMKNPALGGDITFILVKKIAYVQLPQLGGKFMQFKLDDPENPLGGDFVDGFDPRSSVADLEASLQSVTYVGDEVVDGVNLSHYEVVVDAATFEGDDKSAGTHELGMWLDSEDRISRFVFDLGTQGNVTASYSDWGQDVIIEAPAPDDIMSMPGA
ncbi:LppX_LprAFG lipoprotein [Nocardioides sp.]|uniref:LppX_LprAFG lipoprotein n=1 Tax=Nocardioides sp. TaxID=35761 RepID=UPI0035686BA0